MLLLVSREDVNKRIMMNMLLILALFILCTLPARLVTICLDMASFGSHNVLLGFQFLSYTLYSLQGKYSPDRNSKGRGGIIDIFLSYLIQPPISNLNKYIFYIQPPSDFSFVQLFHPLKFNLTPLPILVWSGEYSTCVKLVIPLAV